MFDKKRIIIGISLAALITMLFFTISANNILCIILASVCAIAIWEFYSLLIAGDVPSSKKLELFYQ